MTLPTVHVRVCVSVCVSTPVTQGVSCQTQNSDGSFCLNTGVNGWADGLSRFPGFSCGHKLPDTKLKLNLSLEGTVL